MCRIVLPMVVGLLLVAPAYSDVTLTSRHSHVVVNADAEDSGDSANDSDSTVEGTAIPFDEMANAEAEVFNASSSGFASQTSSLTFAGGYFRRLDAEGTAGGALNADTDSDPAAAATIDAASHMQISFNTDAPVAYSLTGNNQSSGDGFANIFMYTGVTPNLALLFGNVSPGPYSFSGTLPAGDYVLLIIASVQGDTGSFDEGGNASFSDVVFVVPEPCSAALALIPLLSLARRRSR